MEICTSPNIRLPSQLEQGIERIMLTRNRKDIICGNRKKRGEIYLEEDDILIVRKPFYLEPAPPRRSPSPPSKQSEKYTIPQYEDSDTEVEEFAYDSDAAEKV